MYIVSAIFSFIVISLSIVIYKIYEKNLNLKNHSKILSSINRIYDNGLLIFDAQLNLVFVNYKFKNLISPNNLEKMKEFISTKTNVAQINQNNKNLTAKESLILANTEYNIKYFADFLSSPMLHILMLEPKINNNNNPKLMITNNQYALQILAKGIAGEIKSPLKVLNNLIHKSIKYNLDEFKNAVGFEINRINNLINDFSLYSENLELKLEEYNLIDILSEVEYFLTKTYARKNIKILKELFVVPKVKIDKKKIIQVLMNILENSFEAIPEYGGIIEIKTRKRDGFAEIQIIDNGIGIKQNDKNKIFLPFFTTKNQGVGLGLAISQKIIEAHKGIIFFESNEEDKTKFVIQLPILTKKMIPINTKKQQQHDTITQLAEKLKTIKS